MLLVVTGFFSFGAVEPDRACLVMPNDSTSKALKHKENKAARTAAIMSACLPGLGQVYNKRYWKVLMIYGAFAGFGYFFLQNNTEYQKYHKTLLFRYQQKANTEDYFPLLSDDKVIAEKKRFKRYRDIAGIGMGAIYLLNVIDASVDAHLARFDKKIDDDLSLGIRTYNQTLCLNNNNTRYWGLSLHLIFCH